MHIVLTEKVATELRKKYTVLELDTMHGPAGPVPAYCVIPVEKIALQMSSLEQNVKLHEQLIDAMKADDVKLTEDLCHILKGQFGGELDSFYDIIIERVNKTKSTVLDLKQQIT
jgi:hypothetical protein